MPPPEQRDTLSDLSGSLSAEYDRSRAAQRDRVISELKQVVERVPEQIEFTHSRRFKIWGPIMVIGSLVLMAMTFNVQRIGAVALTGFMVLMSVGVAWQHRNAGTQVFMRLTRRLLFVDTLDAPVDMAYVEDIAVKDEGLMMVQTLEMSSDAELPKHRAVKWQFFCNQAVVMQKPRLHIRITSAGLARDGRKLSPEEVLALLAAYRDAAHAQQQLDILQAHG